MIASRCGRWWGAIAIGVLASCGQNANRQAHRADRSVETAVEVTPLKQLSDGELAIGAIENQLVNLESTGSHGPETERQIAMLAASAKWAAAKFQDDAVRYDRLTNDCERDHPATSVKRDDLPAYVLPAPDMNTLDGVDAYLDCMRGSWK